MKIYELIKALQQLPANHDVVLPIDLEGSAFSPIQEVQPSLYLEESPWTGRLINKDEEEQYQPEELRLAKPVIVLWPKN